MSIKDHVRGSVINTTPAESQRAAFAILDATQVLGPGVQFAGVAFMFQLMCTRFNQDPREVIDFTDKAIKDSLSEGRGEYIRAIKEYLKEDL